MPSSASEIASPPVAPWRELRHFASHRNQQLRANITEAVTALVRRSGASDGSGARLSPKARDQRRDDPAELGMKRAGRT